jgi:hypothetical protein
MKEDLEKPPDSLATLTPAEEHDELTDTSKWLGCKILNAILQIQSDCRVNRILFEFSNLSHVYFAERNRTLETSKVATEISNMIMGKQEEDSAKIRLVKEELNTQFYVAYLNGCKNNFFINLSNDQEMSNILLSLTLASDFRLKTQALNLFYDLHSQINMTKSNIEDSILLDSTNTKMSYLDSLNLSRALKRLAETTEKWYVDEGSDELEALRTILSSIEDHLRQPQKRSENIPFTEPISVEPGDGDSDEGNPIEGPKELPELEQYFCKEIKYVVNPFYQNIFRHLEIYDSLISLIKTDIYQMQLEQKPDTNQRQKPHEIKITQTENTICTARHRHMMSRVFMILAYACIDNQENKTRVEPLMQTILVNYLQLDPGNSGLYCFLYEYFTDNYHTVKIEDFDYLMQPILKMIGQNPVTESRKSILLSVITQLSRYQGIINQNNQIYLMQKALPELNKSPKIDFSNPKNLEVLSTLLHCPQEIRVYSKAIIHCMTPTLNYYSNFLRYIMRCGEGRNSQTEYVAQIMLPLKSILELFEVSHKNLAFKDTLLSFFWKIHMSSAKRLPIQLEDIVARILTILATELVEFTREAENHQICDIYILIGTQMEKIDTFKLKYFGRVIQCCFSLAVNLKCLKTVVKGSSEETLIERMIEGVFKYYHLTGVGPQYRDTCLQFMLHLMQKTGPDIATQIKEVNREEFTDLKNSVMSHSMKQVKQKSQKLTTKIIKHGLSMKKFYSQSSKSVTITTLKYRTRLLESTGGQLPVETALVEYLRVCQSNFFNSSAFESLADTEFQGIVKAINMLETESKSKVKVKTAQSMKTTSEFFYSMIQFLLLEAEMIQEKLILIIIQIFIKFLKGVDKEEKNGDDIEDSTEEWKSQQLFHFRQDFLVKLGIVPLICKLLSINRSLLINRQTINLGTYILEGGNRMAQERFFNCFLEDKTNQVIRELYDMIDGSFETVEKFMQDKLDLRIDKILSEGEVKISENSFKGMSEAERERIKEKEQEAEESVTNIKESIKVIKQTLRFFQLLCEGHYLNMQNYLRDQSQYESHLLKRDLVETGAKMLGSFTKINNKNSVEMGIQIIDFLVEIIQGPCIENQVKLEGCKVIEYCKDLLNNLASKKDFVNLWKEIDSGSSESMSRLVAKTVALLGALLEGNQGKAYKQQIEDNLDIKFLIEILEIDLKAFIRRKVKESSSAEVNVEDFVKNYPKIATKNFFDDELLESFQNFFFIQIVCSDQKIIQDYKRTLSPSLLTAYNFYEENTRSIEVVFNGSIQKYYFPIHPACSHLSESMKDKFISTYNRESPNEKMIQFMRATPKFIDYMDYTIARKTKMIPITNTTFFWVRDALLLVSIIINFVNFVWTTQHVHQSEGIPVLHIDHSQEFITTSSILHLVLSSLLFLTWLYVEGPIVQMDAWREKLIDIKSDIFSHAEDSEEREVCKIILQKNVVDQTFIEKQNLLKHHNKVKNLDTRPELFSKLDLVFFLSIAIIKNQVCAYFFFLLLLSALAYAYESPFLYTLFLFDVVHKFETLINVMKAFAYYKTQIFFTMVLEAILVYIFSSFAYYYIDETFYTYAVEPIGENLCVSMWHCFTSIFSLVSRFYPRVRGLTEVLVT